MTQQLKMDLRPKRRPKYRASDQQDPDHHSYTRPNYLKMNTTTLTQDYLSPSGQLNQNAKLLLRFVQKANKLWNDVRIGKEGTAVEGIKNDSKYKEKGVVMNGNTKRNGQNIKSQRQQSQKKEKELYKFKEIQQNADLIKTLSQQQSLKGTKNLQNLANLINNKGIYSGPLGSQLSQLQSLYPNINDIKAQCLNPNINDIKAQCLNKNSNSLTSEKQQQLKPPAKQKPQQKVKQSSSICKDKVIGGQVEGGLKENKAEKLFKRSSYHVAIAYHIFVTNLKNEGNTTADALDPTYKARMVREQAGIGVGR